MKEAVIPSSPSPEVRPALRSIPFDGELQTVEGAVVAKWRYVPPWQSPKQVESPTGSIMLIRKMEGPATEVGFMPCTAEGILKLYTWLGENRQFNIVDTTPRIDLERKKSRETLVAANS